MSTPEQRARLPKWARDELERLEKENQRQHALLHPEGHAAWASLSRWPDDVPVAFDHLREGR